VGRIGLTFGRFAFVLSLVVVGVGALLILIPPDAEVAGVQLTCSPPFTLALPRAPIEGWTLEDDLACSAAEQSRLLAGLALGLLGVCCAGLALLLRRRSA
jgi:hypothetical protein